MLDECPDQDDKSVHGSRRERQWFIGRGSLQSYIWLSREEPEPVQPQGSAMRALTHLAMWTSRSASTTRAICVPQQRLPRSSFIPASQRTDNLPLRYHRGVERRATT
ncbi:hypothetical protein SPRG_19445 [Saprolegnia parasitica CBS 223.65]|uniref:Uncharacterized protein n=1 Tax=Saprolegnia parasitica (strain CBS 223.65) TaxID=695850 RepID=A0A067CSP5_SAPPC|nr:hypothetical protein SPRG_19445 [Saprolegnia parasitica CBS 223.65]KDO32255.1 hypothetical protein SPRG_19445 [Saprolegnia parasitica CBS 223.65]|eukprot:XP_012197059.1 hypothetical protein SPRG_19445 [Saprolegnia parasitica CBS 223.65]